KTIDLKVRPIHHHLADRVRAHVFLCMLAYYVEWHMRRALAPILFDDDDKAAAEAARKSVVQSAQRSPKAQAKAKTKRTDEDLPVHSFRTLLQDLSTLVKDRIRPKLAGASEFDKLTTPTPLQQKALDLLGVRLV
ncbi:MAG: IS1634 family transposase, partial [Longimicrobiales bacterium]